LIVYIAFHVTGGALSANTLVNLAAGLFILPYFLFSATAGQLADKYEKSALIRRIKAAEIAIMLGAAVALYFHHLPSMLALLFLLGVQATFFGPVKYGILPQHLKETEIVGGNALVETGTFVAILLGTMLGGILMGWSELGLDLVAAALVIVAVAGYLASRAIPEAPAVAPTLRVDLNPFRETWRNFRFTRQNRTVFLSILGISWFWFFGAVYLAQLPGYTRTVLGGNEQVVTLLLVFFSVGIGVGSMLCERMSGHKVEIGLVPFGSIGITLFGIDLFFSAPVSPVADSLDALTFLAQPGSWRVLADVVLIGMFGGFYTVPLYALVQTRSEPGHRSRIIAGNNILNALFMVLSSLVAIMLLSAGLSIPQLFLVLALMNAVVAVYIYTLVPEFLMRFLVWLLIHTIYRVEKSGLERIPDEGPALLICNHVSLVDALVIAGCVRRPIRFVMYYKIFRMPVLSFVFRTARAIPIAGAREDAVLMERAFEEVSQALRNGDLVCVFPEGKLTESGKMNVFKPGIVRILERDPVPVIPMALQGLWGSFFSRSAGRAMRGLPRKLWAKIGLRIGDSVPASEARLTVLQERVLALRGERA
ncbi:MAG: MFS transporter, partial [Gammaproteobacteria bacterium]|nr:MFS transporter [Gammaproteobacteria bacterium]